MQPVLYRSKDLLRVHDQEVSRLDMPQLTVMIKQHNA